MSMITYQWKSALELKTILYFLYILLAGLSKGGFATKILKWRRGKIQKRGLVHNTYKKILIEKGRSPLKRGWDETPYEL